MIANALQENRANVIDLGTVGRFEDDPTKTIIDPPQQLPDFALSVGNGKTIYLSDFRGRFIMLYFGYTLCPDACPTTMLDFKRIKASLGDTATNIQFIMISIDPEHDTPETLNQYVKSYDMEFIGLTGTDDAIQQIADYFNVVYIRNDNTSSQAEYLIDHTVSKFLIDPQGRLIRIYPFATDAHTIAEDIRSLM